MGVAWIVQEVEKDSQDEKELHVLSKEGFWLKRTWWIEEEHQVAQPNSVRAVYR